MHHRKTKKSFDWWVIQNHETKNQCKCAENTTGEMILHFSINQTFLDIPRERGGGLFSNLHLLMWQLCRLTQARCTGSTNLKNFFCQPSVSCILDHRLTEGRPSSLAKLTHCSAYVLDTSLVLSGTLEALSPYKDLLEYIFDIKIVSKKIEKLCCFLKFHIILGETKSGW